jgi:hypothetical protein
MKEDNAMVIDQMAQYYQFSLKAITIKVSARFL